MHLNDKEITLLYNSEHEKDRKTLACALTLNCRINRQDLRTVRVSDTLFELMMQRLESNGQSIFNKADPFYQKTIRGRALVNSDYLGYLKRNPSLLRSPLAMYRQKVVQCNTPTDIYKVLS